MLQQRGFLLVRSPKNHQPSKPTLDFVVFIHKFLLICFVHTHAVFFIVIERSAIQERVQIKGGWRILIAAGA